MNIDALTVFQICENIEKATEWIEKPESRFITRSYMVEGMRMALLAIADNPSEVNTICGKVQKIGEERNFSFLLMDKEL